MRHAVSPLPQRIQPHTPSTAEQPQNPHSDPARKELLAEDITCPVQRHGPEDQESEGHDTRQSLGDFGCAEELGLLVGVFFRREAVGAGNVFEVGVRVGGEVGVVAEADHGHGFIVVVLGAKGIG